MYMKLKRFLSMLMAGVLCVGMLAGCGSSKDTTPVVMTVDGEDVQSSELAAYIVYNMMYYENYFGMDVSQLAEETIFDSIKEGHAAGAHPVPGPEELRSRPGGPGKGGTAGPDRLRQGMPHPALSAEEGRRKVRRQNGHRKAHRKGAAPEKREGPSKRQARPPAGKPSPPEETVTENAHHGRFLFRISAISPA